MSKALIEIRNVNNRDTTNIMYYNDGTIVPEDADINGTLEYTQEDLYQAFQEVLTDKEWEDIKKQPHALFLVLVANENGETEEVIFQIFRDDPVMTSIAPDRLYELEKKIKKITKLKQNKSGKYIPRAKYCLDIFYRDLK